MGPLLSLAGVLLLVGGKLRLLLVWLGLLG